MNKIKNAVLMVLCFVLLLCSAGCGGKTKQIKETVYKDAVRIEKQVIGETVVGQRVVGQRIVGYEEYDDVDDYGDTDPETDEDEDNNKPLTDNLIESGKLNYRIIRPNTCSADIATVVADYRKEIAKKLSCTVDYKTDSVKEKDNIREILIGGTNRSATAEAQRRLIANRKNCFYDAIVCTVGKDVVIFAYETSALMKALDYFEQNYLKTSEKKVPTNINWIYESSKTLSTVKIDGKDIGNFRIVIPQNPSQIVLGASNTIQASIEAATGFPIDIVLDNSAATANEIIIGNAAGNIASPENEKAYKYEVSGGKLYISSKSDESLYYAVRSIVSKLEESNTVSISATSEIVEEAVYKVGFSDYSLKWSEEFIGTDLDPKTWYKRTDSATSYNGGQQVRRPDNVWVENGIAKLKSLQTNVKNFSGAGITTQDRFYFKYGYLETRVKLPAGNTYSAWWLNSSQQPADVLRPEIDMLESFASMKTMDANLHTWGNMSDGSIYHINHSETQTVRQYAAPGESLLADEWHILAVEWTPETITFLADGVAYCVWDIRGENYSAFNKDSAPPTYIDYDHILGYNAAANVDESIYEIDWVRLYQKDGDGSYIDVK